MVGMAVGNQLRWRGRGEAAASNILILNGSQAGYRSTPKSKEGRDQEIAPTEAGYRSTPIRSRVSQRTEIKRGSRSGDRSYRSRVSQHTDQK